ncbi:MAG: DNA-processing protein DprA [Rhodanobacteraceae bacterium]|nr:DNA-processing protein DprA [Rhodanobacteraceae bacterium]
MRGDVDAAQVAAQYRHSRQGSAGSRHGATFAASKSHLRGAWVCADRHGIDAAAHQGALDAKGQTIAVPGKPDLTVYPARHGLARAIVGQGALVSEFSPRIAGHCWKTSAAQTKHQRFFVAVGTLVVEASLGSGSLIARVADVDSGAGGVCHPRLDPQSTSPYAATNSIRDGANWSKTAQDRRTGPDGQRMARHQHAAIASSALPTAASGGGRVASDDADTLRR